MQGTTLVNELKRIFDDMDCFADKKYFGRTFYGVIDKDLRLKATFNELGHYQHYSALKAEIIRRDEGVVDSNLIRFHDIWGNKPAANPNFKDGVSPHLWQDGTELRWYVYRPTTEDMKMLSSEIENFVAIYQEQSISEKRMKSLLVNCINCIKYDNDSAIEHLHDICGFSDEELSDLGFDYLIQNENEDDEEMDM